MFASRKTLLQNCLREVHLLDFPISRKNDFYCDGGANGRCGFCSPSSLRCYPPWLESHRKRRRVPGFPPVLGRLSPGLLLSHRPQPSKKALPRVKITGIIFRFVVCYSIISGSWIEQTLPEDAATAASEAAAEALPAAALPELESEERVPLPLPTPALPPTPVPATAPSSVGTDCYHCGRMPRRDKLYIFPLSVRSLIITSTMITSVLLILQATTLNCTDGRVCTFLDEGPADDCKVSCKDTSNYEQ